MISSARPGWPLVVLSRSMVVINSLRPELNILAFLYTPGFSKSNITGFAKIYWQLGWDSQSECQCESEEKTVHAVRPHTHTVYVTPAGIVNLLQQIDLQLKTETKKIKLT